MTNILKHDTPYVIFGVSFVEKEIRLLNEGQYHNGVSAYCFIKDDTDVDVLNADSGRYADALISYSL